MKKLLIVISALIIAACAAEQKQDNISESQMSVRALQDYSQKLDDSIKVLKLLNQAMLHMVGGRWDSSAIHLNMAIALDSSNPVLYRQLTITQIRMGEIEKAALSADKMLNSAPEGPNYIFLYALVMDKNGKAKLAENAYNKCIDIINAMEDEGELTFIKMMATILSGKEDHGREQLKQYIDKTKDDSFAQVLTMDRQELLETLLQ